MRPRVVPPPLPGRPAVAADAEQGLVGQDVLAAEEADLAADEDLAPAPAHGQVDLTHVDLGAEAVVDAGGRNGSWGRNRNGRRDRCSLPFLGLETLRPAAGRSVRRV